MDGLGYPVYLEFEDEDGTKRRFVQHEPRFGLVVPTFSRVTGSSLTDEQEALLSMGYFFILKRDPNLKILVADEDGNIWQAIFLPCDLPALRIDLEVFGVEEIDYGA